MLNKILSFLNKLFFKTDVVDLKNSALNVLTGSFPLGALESAPDPRNIALASFQGPVTLPDDFETVMPPVEYQVKPDCVPEAIHIVKELYLAKKGITVSLSADDLYDQCKAVDGVPNGPGTFPAVGAKVACSVGIATVDAYNSKDLATIAASRAANKLGGYAFVNADYDSICQAIYQNGAVTASFGVDNDWYVGNISKVLQSIGRHYVVLHGASRSTRKIIGQNSWGIKWIGYIAGIVDPSVKPGHFKMNFDDYSQNIQDIIAFADIPPQVLAPVQNTSKIDLWCIATQAYEGWYAPCKTYPNGSVSYRNNNPGNLVYIGQPNAVANGRFAKFDTYQNGYNAMRTLFVNACSGKSANYNKMETLEEFYSGVSDPKKYGKVIAGYAPQSDNNQPNLYAQFVAQRMNVSASVPINSLLS